MSETSSQSTAYEPKGNATRIAGVNVNGIRAAYRKGMAEWLEARDVDILCLQEVRAPQEVVEDLLAKEWHVVNSVSEAKGRAGVLIASRQEPTATRIGIGGTYPAEAGRWAEADFTVNGTRLTVASVYVPSGEVDTPKQVDKYHFLDTMIERLPQLASDGRDVLAVGDMNVGHTERDIKNWKGNVKRAGFLPEERAYFDRFFGEEIGFRDVARDLAGDVEGPYTWWSQRGKAFDNDTGWRIDYHMATPGLASRAQRSVVDRAASYDTRFSDHAPLVVDYQF